MSKRDKQALILIIIAGISGLLLLIEFASPLMPSHDTLASIAHAYGEIFVKLYVWMPQIRLIGLTITALFAGYSAYGILKEKISSKKATKCIVTSIVLFSLAYIATSILKLILIG